MRSAFVEKAPADACTIYGSTCARANRRWAGRPAMACIKKYKLVVRICVRMYECRKHIDAMELTGSPNEEDLSRVALALLNGTVQVGNKELIYNIARTPGYSVGKNFEYQDQYNFLRNIRRYWRLAYRLAR
jgi:hypothetical protein